MLEIFLRENAAFRLACLYDRLGRCGLVEGVRALLGNTGQHRGELGLQELFSRGIRFAILLQEDLCGSFIFCEALCA
ncbi:hypothetical protein AJ87_27770 [Rhizobium yanglingense]|nr:hypothetical protein AJ87_27770 [Rhizobium yanglingense]